MLFALNVNTIQSLDYKNTPGVLWFQILMSTYESLDRWILVILSNSIPETSPTRSSSPSLIFFATSTIIILTSEKWRKTYRYPHKIANGGLKKRMQLFPRDDLFFRKYKILRRKKNFNGIQF